MNYYCLNRWEYFHLIEKWKYNKDLPESFDHIIDILEEAKYFNTLIIGFNYFLSKILEVYQKRDIDCKPILEEIFALENTIYFECEEFDITFINLLIQNLPNCTNSAYKEFTSALNSDNQGRIDEANKKVKRALEEDLINAYGRYKYK